ncbi:MAG TPA: DUF4910 domain-containing protein [Candidatus Acidoferrales bacterium]|nr:DUF4910 domain-containing protein [Candidatus Acidoferrales bacterium]
MNAIEQAARPLPPAEAMYGFVAELFPICRSITGNGVRQTLEILQKHIPLEIREVPTGTQVFDWTVPREWNIRDAYIADASGRRVVDFRASTLHVMSYSAPVRARMSFESLRQHLFTLPDHPDWIPYRTSYYKENWGFCLTQAQLDSMRDAEYDVCIDSTLAEGSLTYAECFLPGESDEEILISAHICHPSLANDNLSGIAVATWAAKHLQNTRKRYSYRFLFVPGTIGAITWLALNEQKLSKIKHGLVLAGLGDSGKIHYKKTRHGNAEIDRTVAHVLRHSATPYGILDFSPYGYDERQYCSPGINLAVGRLSRTPHGTFPEYHTSADNLDFVSARSLESSLALCLEIFAASEANQTFINTSPKCEPQLGRRGLYSMIGGSPDAGAAEMAMLWLLNQSDGTNSLLDIAEKSGMKLGVLEKAAQLLESAGLLRRTASTTSSSAAPYSKGK